MVFEFTTSPGFNFFHAFAAHLKLKPLGNTLVMPTKLGKGTIRKVEFGPDFRLLIHRYRLNEEFIIRRKSAPIKHDLISIFFYHNEAPLKLLYNDNRQVQFSKNSDSAIQLTTNDLNSEVRFPAKADVYYTVIGITAAKLSSLLQVEKPSSLLEQIIGGNGSYLFFERMTVETQRVLKQLSDISDQDDLHRFYYRIKVEQLLYLLFTKLLSRQYAPHRPVNNADVERLMVIRNAILSELSQPPVLAQLAALGGMSETKMKHLFKQTFGDTIYNYYQQARMEEAAFLLKHGGLSVSEVGHQLGFSNLSHFSRVFEQHYKLTPKKYVIAG